MRKNTVTKLRWFWAWQDEAEEIWLTKMSNKGLHLTSVGLPGIYRFHVGEPRDYVYRLDYQTFRKKDRQDYFQLFHDSGWEHVGEMSAWQYFRKEAAHGETPEIFTDVESKIAMYKRVTLYIGFFFVVLSAVLLPVSRKDPYPWWNAVQITKLIAWGVFGYALVRMALKIRRLRRRIR